MNNLLLFLASAMNENDRRALIIVIVLLLFIFLILGLLGMAIRAVLLHQSKAADTLMYDVAVTHVVNNPSAYRRLGSKKNARLFLRQSFIPFCIVALGILIWVIYASITSTFDHNIFEEFTDLFFLWDFKNPDNYTVVFGITLLAKWPELVEGHPTFRIDHLASYIEVLLIIVGSLAYLYAAQGYMVRAMTIRKRSQEVFEKSLKGLRVNEVDPKNIPLSPDQMDPNDSNRL